MTLVPMSLLVISDNTLSDDFCQLFYVTFNLLANVLVTLVTMTLAIVTFALSNTSSKQHLLKTKDFQNFGKSKPNNNPLLLL